MKVIMHNSVSLDMSMKELTIDLKTHYEIVGRFKPDVYLFGSNTAFESIKNPQYEHPTDFKRPLKKGPKWAIVDSKGRLENMLHNFRRSEHTGNLVILISDSTPKSYIEYLKKRSYEMLITGKDQINYEEAIRLLEVMHKAQTIVVDSGGVLNRYLLEQKLLDEISLLINPTICGETCINLFREFQTPVKLELIRFKKVNELLWLGYKIIYD